MKLRFMSYNIQHGVDYKKSQAGQHVIDLPMIAEAIRRQNPDIVGLNEVRGLGPDEDYTDQAEQLAALLGYHCYFACALKFDGINPYGNAILSRFPILSAETVAIPDPPVKDEDTYYETRCVLKARFREAGGFTVLITHFGLAQAERRSAAATVAELLQTASEPAVLMGDFNLKPGDPVLEPISALAEDTAKAFSEPKLSFPSDEPRVKIDYIFTRGCKTLSADIPAVVASDHRPHIAEIDIGE